MATRPSAAFKSLDATTSTGAGAVIQYEKPMTQFMMQTISATTGHTCTLKGSLDGVNYYDLVGPIYGFGYKASSTGLMALFAYVELTTHTDTGPVTAYVAAV